MSITIKSQLATGSITWARPIDGPVHREGLEPPTTWV
jgi:hypothetical protein